MMRTVPQLIPISTTQTNEELAPIESLSSLLAQKFRKTYASEGEPAESISEAFFDYPKINTPARWAYHILSGRFILAPIKNTLKFLVEFIPAVIETVALYANDNAILSYKNSTTIKDKWHANTIKLFAGIGFFISAAIYSVARTTELLTSRITSPMRSFRTAWRTHPLLGIISGLVTVVATGAIAFWTAPFIMIHLIMAGSPTITLNVSRLAMTCIILAAPIAKATGIAYLTNNLLALGAAVIMSTLALVVSPTKLLLTKIFTKNMTIEPVIIKDNNVKEQCEKQSYISEVPSADSINTTKRLSVISLNTTGSVDLSSLRRQSESEINITAVDNFAPVTRYHPSLPTINEVKEALIENERNRFDRPKLIYSSDHLPQLAEINFGTIRLKTINWSLLNSAGCNGFNTTNPRDMSDLVQALVLEKIINIIQIDKPDIIFLQSVNMNLIEKFNTTLPNFRYLWEITTTGLVTLYNFNTLHFHETCTVDSDGVNRIQRLRFSVPSDDLKSSLITNNVQLPASEFPQAADQCIRSLLTEDGNSNSIVAGDFGVSYLPVDAQKPRLIVNSVAVDPEKPNLQKCNFTDGFFYADKHGQIHQPATIITLADCCEQNGASCNHQLQTTNPQQLSELLIQRYVLTCAVEHSDNKLSAKFSEYLKHQDIRLGLCSDAFAAKSLGVFFTANNNSVVKKLIIEAYQSIPLASKQHKLGHDGSSASLLADLYIIPEAQIKFFEVSIMAKMSLIISSYIKICSAMTKAAHLKMPPLNFLDNKSVFEKLELIEFVSQDDPLTQKAWLLTLKYNKDCNPQNLALFQEIYSFAETKTVTWGNSKLKRFFNQPMVPENKNNIHDLIDDAKDSTRRGSIRNTLSGLSV